MIKSGVDLRGIQPQMAIAYAIASRVYLRYSDDGVCVITSGVDGVHGKDSLHYTGYALDLRIHNVHVTYHAELLEDLKLALGPQFDVVLEKDHIHVEFDPKDL